MTCSQIDRWLDDGMPASEAPAAEAHLARCPSCKARVVAAREIERRLAASFAAAPSGFSDAVMRRIAAEAPAAAATPAVRDTIDGARARARLETPPAFAFPWWVRAAAHPASALAAATAALVLWKGEALRRAASTAAALVSGAAARFLPAIAGGAPHSEVALGLALAALPPLALFSFVLYRWTESITAATVTRSRVAH